MYRTYFGQWNYNARECDTESDSCWGWFGVWERDKVIVLEAIHISGNENGKKCIILLCSNITVYIYTKQRVCVHAYTLLCSNITVYIYTKQRVCVHAYVNDLCCVDRLAAVLKTMRTSPTPFSIPSSLTPPLRPR